MELTEKIGEFSPSLLVYFDTITDLDIQGCREIDRKHFSESVIACTNLAKINIANCTQFTQYDLVKMLSNLKNITYINATNCQQLEYCNAYVILSSLPKLTAINFEPQFCADQLSSWRYLVTIFFKVAFGHSVMQIFPHSGANILMARASIEE